MIGKVAPMIDINLQYFGGRGASSSGGGNSGANPAVEKTLNKLVKQTANLKKEQYRIIDENGNVLIKKQGDQDKVVLSVGEKRDMLDGATSLHNHPDGGTFSSADLSDFGYGAREMVVAAPEGTYRLKNMNWGTKEQSSGWLPLREGFDRIADKQSATADMKKARENIAKTKEGKRLTKIGEEWVQKRNAGASQSVLDGLANEYDTLLKKVQTMTKKEQRRLEVEPYHKYFKENAKRYGFKYTFTPNK